MPASVISLNEVMRRMNFVRYLGSEVYTKIPVHDFPIRDLPPVRIAIPAHVIRHPLHLLVPGQAQVRQSEPYIFIRTLGDPGVPVAYNPPVCGFYWANPDVLRVIYLFALFRYAAYTQSSHNWPHLWTIANEKCAPFDITRYPLLWTPTIAIGDAKPGAFLELIHYATGIRYYAVLTTLTAIDEQHALFHAQILGTGEHSTYNYNPLVCQAHQYSSLLVPCSS